MKQELMQDKLKKLMRKKYITPLDALNEAGCLSLSQRAGQFAREGYKVLKRWVTLPNGKRVMSYRIG